MGSSLVLTSVWTSRSERMAFHVSFFGDPRSAPTLFLRQNSTHVQGFLDWNFSRASSDRGSKLGWLGSWMFHHLAQPIMSNPVLGSQWKGQDQSQPNPSLRADAWPCNFQKILPVKVIILLDFPESEWQFPHPVDSAPHTWSNRKIKPRYNIKSDVMKVIFAHVKYLHCWASRHSQGFEDTEFGEFPGLLGQ